MPADWIQAVQELTEDRVVAIDGKTLRGSCDHERDRAAIHMVSAWAAENKLSLGQVVVSEKSNEITAIPELLKLLDISGAVVTIDAMGCREKSPTRFAREEATTSWPSSRTSQSFTSGSKKRSARLSNKSTGNLQRHQTVEKGHGRHEPRTYAIVAAPESVDPEALWRDLSTVGIAIWDRIDSQGRQKHLEPLLHSQPSDHSTEFAGAVRGHSGY